MLIRKAVLAPSSHNTQPWLFRVSNTVLDLRADRTRALPVNDPDDRELTISCGCALMNLRIAAAGSGYCAQVEALPDAKDRDFLARVMIAPGSGSPRREGLLLEFFEKRRTYRKPFDSRNVDSATVEHVVEAAHAEGAWLRPLETEEEKQQAARLAAEGDALQWADSPWRRELAAWMRPRRRGDGLTVPALIAPVWQFVVRTIDMGGFVGAKDRHVAESSPLVAVLGTDGDGPRHWLAAGQALQRVLLVACRHGLQASYLNQPIQAAALRPKLQELIGRGFPQVMLRFGYPVDEIPPSPRRPVKDVIQWASAC
ncbi:MAG: nitroreductase family protein [Desulfosoma sp.]